jgi:hypothetical protein
MLTASKSSYYHSDAPRDYGVGRECSQLLSHCLTAKRTGKRGKVSRYTDPVLAKTENRDEVLLCGLCNAKWIDSGVDAETFIGRKMKQGKAKRYKLPSLQRIRREKGFSNVSQLAKESEVSKDHIKHVESGEWCGTNPTKKLAAALGVEVKDLRGEN